MPIPGVGLVIPRGLHPVARDRGGDWTFKIPRNGGFFKAPGDDISIWMAYFYMAQLICFIVDKNEFGTELSLLTHYYSINHLITELFL